MLLSLPAELQLTILSKLDEKSLCRIARTCTLLHELTKDDSLWSKVISRQFNTTCKISTNFSPRVFYKTILHPFKKLLGIWKRHDIQFYGGGLVKISAKENCIEVCCLDVPLTHDIEDSMRVSGRLSITCDNSGNVRIQIGEEIVAETLPKIEWLENGRLHFYIKENDKLASIDLICSPLKEPKPRIENFPIAEGIFLGTYGGHGLEIIQLTLPDELTTMKDSYGLKITGDPNVACEKVTFRIIDEDCLDPEPADFDSIEDIEQLYHNPRYIKYSEGGTFDFDPPGDMYMDSPLKFKQCKGMWRGEAQVAWHGGVNPRFIPAIFVHFHEDYFGVLFLELGSMSMYRRVTKEIFT
eukprot:TRINITY_DN12261_c0_g1_i11.p1 TRINITY_DN12261_c0_g1~~TRINITY_DN12261_c0_g1_i11.p1  ORF type:complete len:354 (-),score=26.73 TRINITY_DN12261_c0_g1_i11:142-1203(-)